MLIEGTKGEISGNPRVSISQITHTQSLLSLNAAPSQSRAAGSDDSSAAILFAL